MTVEAPKAAEPARARMEGSKSDRLKAGGEQGPGGNAGDFAGLLSLSVIVEDPAEPTTDTTTVTTQAATPADNPTMDVAAMMALLAGSAMTAMKRAAGRSDIAAPEPVALGAIGNPAGPTSAALLAGAKVDGHEGGRAGGVSGPMATSLLVVSDSDALVDAGESNLVDIEQNRFVLHSSALPNGAKVVPRSSGAAGAKSAAGRADTFASEPAASGKAGAALSSVIAPGVDGAQAAAVVSGANGHQSGTALAALLASGKGDSYGGGRPSDAFSELVPPNMLAVTAAMLDGSGRSTGGNSDKAPELAGKPGLESANPGASLGADGVGSTTAVAEMPSLQISDTMLADTVSYWVSQGVQNAELTLDGWGGEAIEVSIQLSNGEALIGFRSDLAETRQLIEGAMDQLKDLLASQGLLLAGVSVGTSSRQDGNPGETPRRPAGRLRGISLAEATTAQPAPRAQGAVGQRLDLFV
jgi:flagellar hook-length control protein FliK